MPAWVVKRLTEAEEGLLQVQAQIQEADPAEEEIPVQDLATAAVQAVAPIPVTVQEIQEEVSLP